MLAEEFFGFKCYTVLIFPMFTQFVGFEKSRLSVLLKLKTWSFYVKEKRVPVLVKKPLFIDGIPS